jgi:hypothetical protein
MIYAQFYQRSVYPPDALIEACGDRSVVIIDARLREETIGRIAAAECLKRGYDAWRIFRGETFSRSAPISNLWPVSRDPQPRDPAWLSAHSM